jgi:tetratricopeptide (TPR) repeat protein
MKNLLFPPEIAYHASRISKETMYWLEQQFQEKLANEKKPSQKMSLATIADIYLDMVEQSPILDAEVVYIAIKLGVFTGKLSRILKFDWPNKASCMLAYQGLALVFMNRFKDAEDSLQLAEKKAYLEKDDATLLETWGIMIYLENARYAYYQGVEILRQALDFYEKIKEDDYRQKLSPFMQFVRISGAKSLLKLGNLPKCLALNQIALEEANRQNDRFFRSSVLLSIGHALDMVGKTEDSIKIYFKALKIAKHIKAHNIVSIIYNRLGMAAAWRLNKLDEGTLYFQEAIAYSDRGEGLWLKEGPQWNLVAAYQAKRDYKSAINLVQDIAFNARIVGESRTELIATLNLAQLLEENGDFKEAEKVREAGESLATLLGINLTEQEVEMELDDETYEENSMEEESDEEGSEVDEQEEEFDFEITETDFERSNKEENKATIEFTVDLGPEDEFTDDSDEEV